MAKLSVFFILENNCFQSHESHLLFLESHLFFLESQWNLSIEQEISCDWKDKVKTTVKDKVKKFNSILRQSIVEAAKNRVYVL